MRWIRVMTLVGMLATAGVAAAQTAPAQTPPEPVQEPVPAPYYLKRSIEYVPATPGYPLSKELQSLEAAQRRAEVECDDCPFASSPTWYYRALMHASMAWQRLHTVCGYAKTGACCAQPVCGMGKVCDGAGCVIGIAGCAKGCEAAQAPKSCCCSKECTCCEMCKASKQKTVQIERLQVQPMPCPMQGMFKIALPPAGMLPMMPPCVPHNVFVPTNLGRTVKLVTPDFEAHCTHISQRGDIVELTGNVLLLCKKNVQPVRIEAQRVLLNLNTGTYVAESGAPATAVTMPATVGVLQMSIGAEGVRTYSVPAHGHRTLESVRPATLVPASGIIEVLPVPQVSPRPR